MTRPEHELPALSVVVCTLNRPERLGPLAAGIAEQLGPEDELLVVDQSRGATAEAGRAAVTPHGRWLAHEPTGLPGARNRAIRETDRPVVLFLDDDVRLHPGCLDGHRRAFLAPRVGGVVGRIVELRLQPNVRRLRNDVGRDGRIRTRLDGFVAGRVGSLKGANMSLRRAALLEAGPFETALGGTALLEDAELSERVASCGWSLVYAPDAAVDHDHDPQGGVRQATPRATLEARFRNIGFFVGRHRPRRDLPLVLAAHAGVAARHRAPVGPLLWVLMEGWREGRHRPAPRW